MKSNVLGALILSVAFTTVHSIKNTNLPNALTERFRSVTVKYLSDYVIDAFLYRLSSHLDDV